MYGEGVMFQEEMLGLLLRCYLVPDVQPQNPATVVSICWKQKCTDYDDDDEAFGFIQFVDICGSLSVCGSDKPSFPQQLCISDILHSHVFWAITLQTDKTEHGGHLLRFTQIRPCNRLSQTGTYAIGKVTNLFINLMEKFFNRIYADKCKDIYSIRRAQASSNKGQKQDDEKKNHPGDFLRQRASQTS